MQVERADPYSTEVRYSLDLMAMYAQAAQPRRARIASRSKEIVRAFVRRLAFAGIELTVDGSEVQADVREAFGVETALSDSGIDEADVALFPFSLEEGVELRGEPRLVVACRNALSYKSLLYPGKVRQTAHRQVAELRPEYRLSPVAYLYPPRFVFWWALAKAVERLDSSWYFMLEDRAMRRLVGRGLAWHLSYVVLFHGRASA